MTGWLSATTMSQRRVDANLFNHLIRPRARCHRDGQAERLGGPQVDHQLDVGGLLFGEDSGLRPLQELVDEVRGASASVAGAHAMRPDGGLAGRDDEVPLIRPARARRLARRRRGCPGRGLPRRLASDRRGSGEEGEGYASNDARRTRHAHPQLYRRDSGSVSNGAACVNLAHQRGRPAPDSGPTPARRLRDHQLKTAKVRCSRVRPLSVRSWGKVIAMSCREPSREPPEVMRRNPPRFSGLAEAGARVRRK